MNKSDILLSVCITTFNMEKYIERAVESVLMQKVNFEFEIIIADDCSTDKTLTIVEKYEAEDANKFKIIRSKINRGVLANCANALKQARGKYIAILDADDFWIVQSKLQEQINILEIQGSVDFVYTNFNYIDESNNQGSFGLPKQFVHPEKTQYEAYLLDPFICPGTICFRKTLIDFNHLNVFIEKGFSSQEYALFLDFMLKGKGVYIKDVTMTYTVRAGSLSRIIAIDKKIKYFHNSFATGNYFLSIHPIGKKALGKWNFNFKLKVLLASWASNDFSYVKQFSKDLQLGNFLRHKPKAAYIYFASKYRILYKVFKPWVLRKRPPGK